MTALATFRRAVSGIVVIAVSACATPGEDRSQVARCDATPASRTESGIDDSNLTGTFRVIQVDTTRVGSSRTARSRTLTLNSADSAQRAAANSVRFGHVTRRDLKLAGWSVDTDAVIRKDTAEVDGSMLFLGCRDCLDASPDNFQITASSSNGFSGKWHNPMSGIATMRDASGNPLPDPAGYFCAVRARSEEGVSF